MSDLVGMLLQAKIDPDAIGNIQKQIEDISKNAKAIKLNINVDDSVLKNIDNINKKIQVAINESPQKIKIDGDFDKLKIHMDVANNIKKTITDTTVKYGEQLQTIEKLNNKTGELELAEKRLTINKEKQSKAENKVQEAIAKTIQKREESNRKAEEQQSKYTNKALEDNYKLQQQEELRIKKLGEPIGSVKKLNFTNDEQMKKYLLSLQEIGAEVTRFERCLNSAGQSQIKMTTRTQQSKDMVKEQKFVIDENTQALYKQNEALKPNINRMLGWAESMKVAAVKSIQWAISMSLIYGNLKKLKEGIQTIRDLENQTQQIQMVTKMTTEEVNELTKSYSKLSQELGTSVTQTMEAATGYFRQGLNTQEVNKRLGTTIKLSAVLGQSLDTTAEQITAGMNSMEVEAERLGDVVTKVGAVAGTSGQEIMTIVQLAGATAKQAGISLEELAAMGGTISEATRLAPQTIGNALNTIIAKFQQVNSLTGEINEDYGKIINAIENIGISSVDKITGQLRPVNDILVDLGKIWDDLDKKTQNYITNTIGVRQFNRFASLLGNISRQQELLNEGQNSTNELTEQYSVYLDKTEAAAQRSKNALETMWNNAINPQFLKQFYDFQTIVIQIIDKIGVFKVALFAINTILLVTSKRFKTLMFDIITTSVAAGSSISVLGLMKGAILGLGASFDILKLKQAAATMGISLLITALITGIGKIVNASKELARTNDELVQTYKSNITQNNDNIKRLKELSSEYNNIKKKINNQIELNNEEKATIEELIQINPTLVQGYNERGEAIIDTTQNIKDMIEEIERANEIEDIKLSQGGEDFFKESKKEAENYIKKLDDINFQIDTIKSGIAKGKTGDGEYIRDYITSLDSLKKQYEELSQAEKESLEGQNTKKSIEQKEQALKSLTLSAKEYQQLLNTSSTDVHNALFAQARLSDSYKNLSSNIKSLMADYIRMMNVSDYKDFMDMQQDIDNFIEALKNANFNDAVKTYQGLVKQFEEGKISAEEFDEKIKEIIARLLKNKKIPDDIITKFFKDSGEIEEAKNAIEGVADGWDTNKQALEDLTEQYEKSTEKLQDYYVFLDELNSKEGLSAQSKDKIIRKYEELLPFLSDEEELHRQLIDATKDEEDAQRTACANKLILTQEFYNAKIKGNAELVEKLNEYYNGDFEHYTSLADAKGKVEAKLISQLSDMWAGFYGIIKRGNVGLMIAMEQQAAQGVKGAQEVLDAQRKVAEMENHFKSLALDLGGIDFKGINTSKVKDPKRERKEQLAKDIEYNINLLRKQELALEAVRKQLAENKREQDMASDGARIRLKEKEIKLLKEEQQALHGLANAAREVMLGKGVQIASDGRVIKEGINGLKQQLEATKVGFKFNVDTLEIENYNEVVKKLENKVNSARTKKQQDKIKEETDAIIKLADAYNDYLKVAQDAGGQWKDKNIDIYKNSKEIEDAIKSLEEDLISIRDNMKELNEQRTFEQFQNDLKESLLYLEPFANELELLRTKFDLLSNTDYDGRMDIVAEQFDKSQRYGKKLRREFNHLSGTTTNTSQETDELINTLTNLQQQIKQNTLNTIEYQKTLDNLRIDQIVNQFTDVNKALERELSLVDHNLKMLEGGLLAGTDIVFGVDFALPSIPEDLIDKKRKENEELIREQQRYEDEIQELKELSLEQQEREQQEHYDKAMSELIKHYDDVINKIKDYHDIELDEQSDHQYNVNDIIEEGLTTTADNYNNTWVGIVENLRGYLAEIENMISSTNANVNSVSTPTKKSSSGGGGGSRGSSSRETWDERTERKRLDKEYDKANSKEIDRIEREHGVDSGVARDMDKANKRAGTKIYGSGIDYHDGGLAVVKLSHTTKKLVGK